MHKSLVLWASLLFLVGCTNKNPISISVEHVETEINVTATLTEEKRPLTHSMHHTITLSVDDKGIITDDHGRSWTIVEEAIESASLQAIAALKAQKDL